MVDIVVLAYNRFKYLRRTIQALIQNTGYPCRLVVVDNSSTDFMVKEYLKNEHENGNIHKLIFNPTNLILKGWQKGLAEVTSPFFAITDPDIIVPGLEPCWLTQLVKLLEEFPRLARIGLSLEPENVPLCWTRRQAKRLAFRTGPFFDKERRLRIIDVDTTMQLIRTESFRESGGFEAEELNMSFWKKFHKYGLSVAAQHISALHLGWNEYIEEPEYLIEKTRQIREYPEKDLIGTQPYSLPKIPLRLVISAGNFPNTSRHTAGLSIQK